MRKTTLLLACVGVLTLLTACVKHYQVASVERTRILIDNRWDARPVAEVMDFIQPYKHVVDSVMGPVVGHVAKYLDARRPESTLSNLLPDILVWAAKDFNETADFGVYNMGGIRAALAKGPVTYGDVLDVAPFDNKICFVTLTGEQVMELFRQIAKTGGEGVSHGVELVITRSGQLKSARLNGEPIDPARSYRVTTIDYLLQGNDKMTAFRSGSNILAPQDERNNSRFIIMNYFKTMEEQGIVVDANLEGRIKVEDE